MSTVDDSFYKEKADNLNKTKDLVIVYHKNPENFELNHTFFTHL